MVRRYESPGKSRAGGLVIAIVFFSSISTIFAQGTPQPTMPTAEQVARANITYKVISSDGGGYGYDVFMDGKRLIHQTNIPGRPGVTGFRTKEDSKRVAELVVKKMKNKEMPPAITEEELRQLKVID